MSYHFKVEDFNGIGRNIGFRFLDSAINLFKIITRIILFELKFLESILRYIAYTQQVNASF